MHLQVIANRLSVIEVRYCRPGDVDLGKSVGLFNNGDLWASFIPTGSFKDASPHEYRL